MRKLRGALNFWVLKSMPNSKKKQKDIPASSDFHPGQGQSEKKSPNFSQTAEINSSLFPQLWMDSNQQVLFVNPAFYSHFQLKPIPVPFPFESLKKHLPVHIYENIEAVNKEFVKPLPLCYLEEEDYFIIALKKEGYIETLISVDKNFQPFRPAEFQNGQAGNNILSKRSLGTVLRLRLRQFSQVIDSIEPENIRNILSKYCEEFLPIFKNYQGSEFQIMGNEIMEIYDSSQGRPDHALAALEAGFIQIEMAKKISQMYAKQKIPLKNISAGLDSGELVIGNLDTPSRSQFTVIGKAAQVAEDLTHLADECEIVISENTLNSILKNLPPDFSIHWEGVDPLDVNAEKMLTLKKRETDYIYFKFIQVIKPRSQRHPIPVFLARLCKNDLLPRRKHSQPSSEEERDSHLIFGKYRLILKLGKGGMGEVWKALDPFGNTLAIKTMINSKNASEMDINRFRKEADIMSRLNHRSICRVFEVGKAEGLNYIAMQYIEGVPLSRILDRRVSELEPPVMDLNPLVDKIISQQIAGTRPTPSPEEEKIHLSEELSVNIILEICEIIKYAHEHNVYHRDIKPQNIMINRESNPILMDFGVAKLDSSLSNQTISERGQIFGTIEYMAPEQADANVIDNQKADIFAIGAVLYQMLTGNKHYVSTKNIVQDIKNLQTHNVKKPKFYNKKINSDLEAIVLKCLRSNPSERYNTAEELILDLRNFQANKPVIAKRPSLFYHGRKFISRHKMEFSLVCMVLCLALTGVYQTYKSRLEQLGSWVLSERIVFADNQKIDQIFEFNNSLNSEPVAAFPIISSGMLLKSNQWSWYKNSEKMGVNRDGKIVIRFSYYGQADLLKIQINSLNAPLPKQNSSPQGFSVIHGSFEGSLDVLTKTWPDKSHPNILLSAPSRIKTGVPITVEIIKENNSYTYVRNGETLLRLEAPANSHHPIPQQIGFFTKSENLVLHSMEIYRKSLPVSTSPMVLADGLVKSQNYLQAVKELVNLSKDLKQKDKAEAAIFKAYQILYENGDQHGFTCQNLMDWMKQKTPNSPYLGRIYDLLSEKEFQQKNYKKAILYLDSAFVFYPNAQVLARIDLNALPPEIFNAVMHYAKKNVNFTGVAMESSPDLNFNALSQWDLQKIQWKDNQIQSLSPLSNLPLNWLDVSENYIMDISPLKGKFLQYLDISHNKIHDITMLKGMLLENLNLEDNQMADISTLNKMPLRRLNLANNKISDLTSLQNSPLYSLIADKNTIFDISPIANQQLRILSVEQNQIENINALRKIPLIYLNLKSNSIERVPKLNNTNLKYLNLSDNPLKEISSLKNLSLFEAHLSNVIHLPIDILNSMKVYKLNISNQNFGDSLKLDSPYLKDLKADSSQISTLSGISGLKLKRLSIAQNQIRDFSALKTMELSYLNIEGNYHSNLGWIMQSPPDTTQFFNDNLSAEKLWSIVHNWQEQEVSDYNLHYAKTAFILKSASKETALSYSSKFRGKSYVHFPQKFSLEKAKLYAQLLGGELANPANKEEQKFILSITRDIGPKWILESEDNELDSHRAWAFGDIYNRGDLQKVPLSRNLGFIVEWSP